MDHGGRMQRLRQRLSIMRREAYVSCRGFDGIPTRVCSAAALRKAGYDARISCEAYVPNGFETDAPIARKFFDELLAQA